MTPTNYDKHFKALGKMAKLYDLAAPDVSAQRLTVARAADQVATGDPTHLIDWINFEPQLPQFANAFGATATAVRQETIAAAGAYLTSEHFRDDLTTNPITPGNAASVLDALATDMSAGVDDKTLATQSPTGLVNFFVVIGASAAWNTEDESTADYKDGTYVVTAVVP